MATCWSLTIFPDQTYDECLVFVFLCLFINCPLFFHIKYLMHNLQFLISFIVTYLFLFVFLIMEQAGDLNLPLVIRSLTLVLVTLIQRFLQLLLCRRQGFPKNVRSCEDPINPVECLECLKYPEFCSAPCNELADRNFLFA